MEDLFYFLPNGRNSMSSKASHPSDIPPHHHPRNQIQKNPLSKPLCRCLYRMPAARVCGFSENLGYPGARTASLFFPWLPAARPCHTCPSQTCKWQGWVPALRGASCISLEAVVCSSSATQRKELPKADSLSLHPGSASGLGRVQPEELIGVPCNCTV